MSTRANQELPGGVVPRVEYLTRVIRLSFAQLDENLANSGRRGFSGLRGRLASQMGRYGVHGNICRERRSEDGLRILLRQETDRVQQGPLLQGFEASQTRMRGRSMGCR